jgi:hypothetical protein
MTRWWHGIHWAIKAAPCANFCTLNNNHLVSNLYVTCPAREAGPLSRLEKIVE